MSKWTDITSDDIDTMSAEQAQAALARVRKEQKRVASRLEMLYTLEETGGRIEKRLAELAKPDWMEPYYDGSIVTWAVKFSPAGRTYSYAAIKGGGQWYCTTSGAQNLTWRQLIDNFVTKPGLELVAGPALAKIGARLPRKERV